ncbi:MAG: SIR2 family protein, partial [Microbacteriaceae bacterium]
GDLILGLVELLHSLATEYDVDIILATYGGKSYAAAQRSRRRLLVERVGHRMLTTKDLTTEWRFASSTPADLPAKATRLAEAAIDRHLVLFIGAGVSAGAGIPTWKNLLRQVAQEAGVDPGYIKLLEGRDIRDWATLIDRKMNSANAIKHTVADLLQRTQRCSLQHALLASLRSTEAVTTNFDQLFEIASRVADDELAVLPTRPRKSGTSWLLKLHGSVNDPPSIILTRSDYLDMPRNHGALMGLVQGLLLTRHMMYVGYSLSDEDFHELVHEVRRAQGAGGAERATVLTLEADETQVDLWRDDLDIIAMGPVGTDVPIAARELEIFLDLVGFLSTTSAAFFLDPTYRSLTEDESELRDLLSQIAGTTAGAAQDRVAHHVDDFLSALGAPQHDNTVHTARVTAEDLRAGRIRIPSTSTHMRLEQAGPLELDLRETLIEGEWIPSRELHRCGALHLSGPEELAFLVDLGERLMMTVDGQGRLVLR